MQAFTVALLWLGAFTSFLPTDAAPDRSSQVVEKQQRAFTSDGIQLDDLSRLPTDIILNIGSRVISNFVSDALLDRFGARCLRATIRVENAPPGQIFLVIKNLLASDQLRSSQSFDSYVLEALELADDVGHCDLIPVLSDNLRNSSSYRDNFSSLNFERASCDDVDRLAALPLQKLLGMHALPRHRFLQVIDIKYHRSDYESFFHDPAWKSRRCSNTVMSHALRLYEELNGEFDFHPVPFGHIASTQSISEPTLRTLENTPSDHLWRIISYLQLVLKPEPNLRFWPSSNKFRTQFLAKACLAGRLDWIKFMLNHHLWRNVMLPDAVICRLGTLARDGFDFVLPYADLLEVDDPVLSAFERMFYHQMGLRDGFLQWILQETLLADTVSPRRLADPARQIVRAFKTETWSRLP